MANPTDKLTHDLFSWTCRECGARALWFSRADDVEPRQCDRCGGTLTRTTHVLFDFNRWTCDECGYEDDTLLLDIAGERIPAVRCAKCRSLPEIPPDRGVSSAGDMT